MLNLIKQLNYLNILNFSMCWLIVLCNFAYNQKSEKSVVFYFDTPSNYLLELEFLSLIAHLHDYQALGWCFKHISTSGDLNGLVHTIRENNLGCAVDWGVDDYVTAIAVDAGGGCHIINACRGKVQLNVTYTVTSR